MKMKRIANNVALQTIGYVISGFTNVYIYVRECGYQKRDIYRGLYKHFAHDEMNKYAYCKITELRADENVLYIGGFGRLFRRAPSTSAASIRTAL